MADDDASQLTDLAYKVIDQIEQAIRAGRYDLDPEGDPQTGTVEEWLAWCGHPKAHPGCCATCGCATTCILRLYIDVLIETAVRTTLQRVLPAANPAP